MNSKQKIIIEDVTNDVKLRSIDYDDIEFIRKIKNHNRKSFFYQEIISKEQQIQWFNKYLEREKDWIFVVSEAKDLSNASIGCVGFRMKKNIIDIYNVIRGKESLHGVSMMDAMKLMVSYIKNNFSCRINCEVLKSNPAVDWYKKCGFVITNEYNRYLDMEPQNVEIRKYIERIE